MEKKIGNFFLIFNAPEPNLKEERVRIDIEFVEGLCNEVCNLNLDVKNKITKVIRLGKKQNIILLPTNCKCFNFIFSRLIYYEWKL